MDDNTEFKKLFYEVLDEIGYDEDPKKREILMRSD